jgi:hypothetical protein
MKTFTFVFLLVLFVSAPAITQPALNVVKQLPSVQKEAQPDIYPMPAPYTLHESWQRMEPQIKAYIQAHPEKQAIKGLKKATWSFSVGTAKNWYATDLNPSSSNYYTEYSTPSTCRAVGSNCYIFVEDSLWTNGTVTTAAVNSMRTAFETSTPADPSKGIFQLDTMYFGNPPDVDGDAKIIILILDIKDGFSGSGGYIAGYFYGINEYSDADVQAAYGSTRHSNEAEIYYVDANPANLRTPSGITGAASTTAHEFQHMIHFNYDGSELAFVNEGMSESASKLCGYGLRSPSLYYENPNVNFLSWGLSSNVLRDYSRAALFSWYLIEQFGSALTKQIVQNSLTGINGYNSAFQTVGSPLRYNDVLKNFAVAVGLNNATYDSRYGFTSSIPGKPSADTYFALNVPTVTDTVQPYGTQYLKFVGGQSLSFTANSAGTLEVKAIATGSTGTRVDNITLGSTYTLSDFGTNYSTVVIAVTNLTNSATIFTYNASGNGGMTTSDLLYADDAAYYMMLSTSYVNSKYAVRFSPVTSGSLYAVYVAVNGGTSAIKGTGNLRVSAAQNNPSGSVGGTPSTQIGSSVLTPLSQLATGGWNEINTLDAGINITSGTDFHVVLDMTTATDSLQLLMDDGSFYPTNRTSAYRTGVLGLGWYNRADPNYSSGRSPTYENILLAVTIATPFTGVEESQSKGIPNTFVLDQNYPNPFNPSTSIQFQIPSRELVTLKVYDIMGREVATLANGIRDAGNYTIQWSAAQLSSGVYWYRLTAGTFVQTNKMLLLK